MQTKETRLDRERSRRLSRGVRAARCHQSPLEQSQRRLASGVRSLTRRATRIAPDAKQAAEECLAGAASSEERQFWESYLAAGDNDSYAGFMPAGGQRAAESGAAAFAISDLETAAKRQGKLGKVADVPRAPRSLASVIRSMPDEPEAKQPAFAKEGREAEHVCDWW
jgi:hypothetical protein